MLLLKDLSSSAVFKRMFINKTNAFKMNVTDVQCQIVLIRRLYLQISLNDIRLTNNATEAHPPTAVQLSDKSLQCSDWIRWSACLVVPQLMLMKHCSRLLKFFHQS